MRFPLRWTNGLALALVLGFAVAGGCSDGSDGRIPGTASTLPDGGSAGAPTGGGTGGAGGQGGAAPDPQQYEPCTVGDCWPAPELLGFCGSATVDEDFSTGLYNVHEYPLTAPAEVPLELTLLNTAGAWDPVLLVVDETGFMVHDGEIAFSDASMEVELVSTGHGSDTAAVRLTAHEDKQLSVFATAWSVVESGFADPLPQDATYSLTVFGDCQPGQIDLLSPPNFDPNDVVNGYYLLPPSEPPGLYTRKHEGCSRGNRRLIDVIYTVAWHWHQRRPALAPIAVRDMNENIPVCVTDHDTHDDGTHADLVVTCATDVYCTDKEPVLELAKLFIDTGYACGIVNDQDQTLRDEVNAYFESQYSYEPWWGTFMRNIGDHTGHFHIRVMKPDGTCN